MAPRDNPKEEEIWDCSVGRKYQGVSGYDTAVILVTSLPIRRRVNSGLYDESPTGRNVRPRVRSTRRNLKIVFPRKKKKKDHTAACTIETLTKLGYTLLCHPSPNPTVLILHNQIFIISAFWKTACSDNITWTRHYRTPCSNGEQILPVGNVWSCARVEEGLPNMESVLKNCCSFSNVVAQFLKFSHV